MFDSHFDDFLSSMNDNSAIENRNNSNSINKQKTSSRGLIDLLEPPPSQQPTSSSSNDGSSTTGSTTTTTTTTSGLLPPPQLKRGSSYLINKQQCQPLKLTLNEWRTDFYPNLSYNCNSVQDEQQQQQQQQQQFNNESLDFQDNEQSKKEEKEPESLLQQRVKQWQYDIHSEIKDSSKQFYQKLPRKLLLKNSNNNNNNNQQQQKNESGLGVEDSFLQWRNQFNDAMDSKMKETKRSTKIIITSR